MAELNDNFKGAFGGVNFNAGEQALNNDGIWKDVNSFDNQNENAENVNQENQGSENNITFRQINNQELPIKPSIWTKIKSFLCQEVDLNAPIKVELTPYQQQVENEINDFLHQEVSFKGFFNLFKS